MLGVGEVLPFSPTRRRRASLPVDVARTIEDALDNAVARHRPRPRAVRAERLERRPAPLARAERRELPRADRADPLDAADAAAVAAAVRRGSTPAPPATGDAGADAALLPRRLPGDPPRRRRRPRRPPRTSPSSCCSAPARSAPRCGSSCARSAPCPPSCEWHATVWSPRPLRGAGDARARRSATGSSSSTPARVPRDRGAGSAPTSLVLASEGIRTVPGMLVRALAAGVVPVASRLPAYEELLGRGRVGLAFEPGDVQTLTGQLSRLVAEPAAARASPATDPGAANGVRAGPASPTSSRQVYAGLVARRHDTRGDGPVRSRLTSRRLIDVDLHMHTDHSYDCATPVEVLLAEARARGLGAIAVTDHNEISGRSRRSRQGRRDHGDRRRGGQDRRTRAR